MKAAATSVCILAMGLLTSIPSRAESSLPPCQGSDSNTWHNCFGKQETYAGGVYEGQFRFGKRDGAGQWYEVYVQLGRQREIYVGEFKEDMRHGRGEFINSVGEIYSGDWKENQRDGEGTEKSPSGEQYVGQWKSDRPNGRGTKTWADGRQYVGEFSRGNGIQGILTWPNGAKFEGPEISGAPTGDGTLSYPDGSTITGRFSGGRYIGPTPGGR